MKGRWAVSACRAAAVAASKRRTLLTGAATAALLATFIAGITQVAARTYNPFIYFRF